MTTRKTADTKQTAPRPRNTRRGSRRPRNFQGPDAYQRVTDQILEHLDAGTVPWRCPYRRHTDGTTAPPTNAVTRNHYRGINVPILNLACHAAGYRFNRWMTFNQAKARGGQVRRGERGTYTVFHAPVKVEDRQTGEPIRVFVARGSSVFNVAQIDGLSPRVVTGQVDAVPDEAQDLVGFEPGPVPAEATDAATGSAAALVGRYLQGGKGPTLEVRYGTPCYVPSIDAVHSPPAYVYESTAAHYATIFHEFAHSTGHPDRLNRFKVGEPFHREAYAYEELVAEFAAAVLMGVTGLDQARDEADGGNDQVQQSAAYIDGWRKALRQDPKLLIRAASAGHRAADWIQGVRYDAAAEGRPADAEG